MIVKDPTIVLNRAWSNLENRNNPEALTAARCVRLMPSSSDEQRRQADFVISLIDEITSTEMNNHQLRNVSLDASLVKRIQRIRDVSTGQYAALGQPQVKPSEKATTSNISSRVLPHGLSEGLPQICADHSMAILHTDGGTDATSRFKQQAFKESKLDTHKESQTSAKPTKKAQNATERLARVAECLISASTEPESKPEKKRYSPPPVTLPYRRAPNSLLLQGYVVDCFDREAFGSKLPKIQSCIADYAPKKRPECVRVKYDIPKHATVASSVEVEIDASCPGNPNGSSVILSNKQRDCIKDFIRRLKFRSDTEYARHGYYEYQP